MTKSGAAPSSCTTKTVGVGGGGVDASVVAAAAAVEDVDVDGEIGGGNVTATTPRTIVNATCFRSLVATLSPTLVSVHTLVVRMRTVKNNK